MATESLPEMIDLQTMPCPFCGKTGMVRVRKDEYLSWISTRGYIQDMMPSATADQREQVLNGSHQACFDAAFAEEDEDDEDWTPL